MIRRTIAGLLVSALLSIPAPVYAHHGEPMYRIFYYSDAARTVEVGEEIGGCGNGVVYTLTGERTQYAISTLLAYCVSDGPWPYLEPA